MDINLINNISKTLSVEINEENLEKLHGDASTRIYWRLNTSIGTWIVSEQEPFSPDSDFINIANFLTKHNIAVPKIINTMPDKGIIITQDIGNDDLFKKARDNVLENLKLYEEAIDTIIKMQTKLPTDNSCIAFKRAFDEPKWLWELEHTENYFFRRFLNPKLSDQEWNLIKTSFKNIAKEIDLSILKFSHRDYHSRNILYFNKKLFLIDFQDARLGPPLYDLVSILRDCYIELPKKEEAKLIQRYKNGINFKIPNFEEQYLVAALQRHLKACGTFAYQSIERKNNFYLKFIRHTWDLILQESKSLPVFKGLHTLFNKISLPENLT